MRIISGKHRGKKLKPPRKNPARPTTDFAKEGLFNIISNAFDYTQITVLDLFGGTGNISFEFASRGCPDITCVELFGPNVSFIGKMAEEMDMPLEVIRMDVFQFISKAQHQWNIIFAGPPYRMQNLGDIPDLILGNMLLHDDGWLILEHNPNHDFRRHPALIQKRNYGSTIFSIFSPVQS